MSVPPANQKTVRVMRDGRLAYHRAAADAAYWDEHWQRTLSPEHYADALQGRLGRFDELFMRWLPRQGRVLEAGCGTGYYVAALRTRGYDAHGIEWGPQTVAAINRILPDLPVLVGDVTALGCEAGAYTGYVSLGVMEHREAGPEPFLNEAWRVLADGGVALISVPNLHPLRRWKAKLGVYRGDTQGLAFYQYAYPTQEFSAALRRVGFSVELMIPYDGFKGIKDELPGSRSLLQLLKKSRLTKTRLERSRFGHMMMYVCRKPTAALPRGAMP